MRVFFLILSALLLGTAAVAHVSERALVLLLPTDVYIRSGVVALAATLILLAFFPPDTLSRSVRSVRVMRGAALRDAGALSLASTALLFTCIYIGITGSRDPLSNMLPLLIWVVWWITIPVLQMIFGDIWRRIDPWTGLYRLLRLAPPLTYPERWGHAPAVVLFLAFSLFQVADIAPDDPDRLAIVVLGYWGLTFVMMLLFGPVWLQRGEPFTIYFTLTARLSTFFCKDGAIHAALPGARLTTLRPTPTLAALFVAILGAGSFDGLNETFWWLAQIGINPLAFPGRSAVQIPNSLGLLGGVVLLAGLFGVCVWLGARATGPIRKGLQPVSRLSASLLPIAIGYHIAHYFTSFLVGVQYVRAAATDPLTTGADYLGLGTTYVTTSFFNVPDTVKLIWLTQASAIVIGHILAVYIAHVIALDMFKDHKKALVSQLPVSAFMLFYTFFGLWILAQPTGA